MTKYQQKSEEISLAIRSNDYYVALFDQIKSDFHITSFYGLSDVFIIDFWNTFWEALPDSKSIHRSPFYQICDIAAGDI